MSFVFKNATISARELTIADENKIRAVALRLNDATAFNDAYEFGEFLLAATIDGEPPVPVVTAADSEADVRASYAAWQKLPRGFLRQWRAELRAAESPNGPSQPSSTSG